MSTIGSVILKLEAQHAQLLKGLQESNRGMTDTANHAQSMGSIFKAAFAGIAVGLAVAAVRSWTEEVLTSATAAYRLSDSLGITTGSLQELQAAGMLKAGLSAEEFNGTLNKMTKNLGEAAEGSGPAAEALERLGLSGGKLAGLHTDEVFKKIAQRISEIKDPTAQARAATEIFGKEGQKLLPLFRQGAKGIEEAAEKARHFGTALSETDAAKLVDANEKFDQIGMAVEGVKNQLVIALAPILGTIADKILDLVPAADKMQQGFTAGIHYVGQGVGYLIDGYHYLKVGILAAVYGGIAAMEGLLKVTGKVAEGIIFVHNKFSSSKWEKPAWIDDSISSVDQWRKTMGDEVKEAWNQPSAKDSVNKFFANIEKKATETAKAMADKKHDLARPLSDSFGDAHAKIDKELADMAKSIGQFGLTDAQKKLFDLEGMGANKEQLKLAQQYSDELKRLEDRKKETEAAAELTKRVTESNPITKYQSEMAKLDKMHHDGLISAQTYAAGVAEANDALGSSLKELAEDRKTEAQTRRFDFKGPAKGPAKADPLKQLTLNLQKQQTESAKQSQFYLQQLWQFGMNNQNQDQPIDF